MYTTVYPGVENYLADWYRSVREQTDRDYDLWIGLDALDVETAIDAMGGDPKATWVIADAGDTPALVRQRAWARIVESYDDVVLVDSDDVLHESRVAAARETLRTSDLAACALRLVDRRGRDLGFTYGLPNHAGPDDVFPRNNVFGLSNSAFRSRLLRECLPIPADVALVDWFLATRAWLSGAKLVFDDAVRMDYRQHDANMARIRPPFDPMQITRDTGRVMQHFQLLRSAPMEHWLAERVARMENVSADVAAFHERVVLQPEKFERYVEALNGLEPAPLWWSSVAYPPLKHMWT